MSPRKAKPKAKGKRDITHDDERELSTSNESIEEHDDGIFVVRKISGSTSNKPYRCPGCDQEIRPATPHTVAYVMGELEDRRHWHTPCWNSDRKKHKRDLDD